MTTQTQTHTWGYGYVNEQQAQPVKQFTVVYRTAAGYVRSWWDYDTYAEAEAKAIERAEATGRSHWVAAMMTEVEPNLSVRVIRR